MQFRPGALGSLVAAALVVLTMVGCEGRGGSQGDKEEVTIPGECTELFAQCALPDGPIGVCDEVPCTPGRRAPCLKCFSQH